RVFALYRLAEEIATRALENESAGGNVPKADSALDIRVEPPGRDVDHREGRGAHDPNLSHFVDEGVELRQHFFEAACRFGKTDRDECFLQTRTTADRDALAVQLRWQSPDRGKSFGGERIVHNSNHRFKRSVRMRGRVKRTNAAL